MFRIRMGVPDMELFWDDLLCRIRIREKEEQTIR